MNIQKEENPATVQGTNDSSIVSKASMASLGYFNDAFLRHFVKRLKRRAPIINRGYYVRMKAIDYFIRAFLRQHSKEPKCQIVSLGAGFEPSYFRLKSMGLLHNVTFVEVDYKEVINRKAKLIMATDVLRDLCDSIEYSHDCSAHIGLDSTQYKLLGCDLNYLDKLDKLLIDHKVSFECPTFFLSECVMTYMEPDRSSAIIEWVSSRFISPMFVCYEQILPQDAFGRVMRRHFIKLQSPLRCIELYPSIQSQIQRFKDRGWEIVNSIDMNTFYNTIEKEERSMIDHIEPFDEFEEWHLKCSHYTVVMALKNDFQYVPDYVIPLKQQSSDTRTTSLIPSNAFRIIPVAHEAIQRFGHACLKVASNATLICGGFGVLDSKHTRLSNGYVIKIPSGWPPDKKEISISEPIEILPEPRLFSSLTTCSSTQALMIGGRKSPHQPYKEPLLVDLNLIREKAHGIASTVTSLPEASACVENHPGNIEGEIINYASKGCASCGHQSFESDASPSARWRHVACNIKDCDDPHTEYIFVHGGRDENTLTLSDSWLYKGQYLTWTKGDSKIAGRHSHTATYWSGAVVLYGGLNEESVAVNSLEVVHLKSGQLTVSPLSFNPPLPCRYSHTAHIMKDKLIVIGGIDPENCPCMDLLVIDLIHHNWHGYSFPMGVFNEPFLLHNHCSTILEDDVLLVIGGGGNCFSFGTHLNSHLVFLDLRAFQ